MWGLINGIHFSCMYKHLYKAVKGDNRCKEDNPNLAAKITNTKVALKNVYRSLKLIRLNCKF